MSEKHEPAVSESGALTPTDEQEEPVPNPGLPPHEPRLTDVDERAAKRAERQVAAMFGIASLALVGFVVAYLVVPVDASFLGVGASNLALGGCLGLALLLIGLGAVHWSRKLMSDHEVVEERHAASSTSADREQALEVVGQGVADSGFGKRKLIRRSLLGAFGLLGIAPLILLGDLGPLPGTKPAHTVWRRRMRVVNDVNFEPIKASDLQIGQLVNAVPESLKDMHGAELHNAKAKAAVILIRMDPSEVKAYPKRRDWGVDGILCYSKICTHVGCPTNLYEQHTKHLLCPCHQSTFDLANNGKVVFGPAARSMPQLPIMVDSEGYLVAQSDFTEPVGPSYWERG